MKCLVDSNTLFNLDDTSPVTVFPVAKVVVQDLQFCVFLAHVDLQKIDGLAHVITIPYPVASTSPPLH